MRSLWTIFYQLTVQDLRWSPLNVFMNIINGKGVECELHKSAAGEALFILERVVLCSILGHQQVSPAVNI